MYCKAACNCKPLGAALSALRHSKLFNYPFNHIIKPKYVIQFALNQKYRFHSGAMGTLARPYQVSRDANQGALILILGGM